jgi:hypothetical protein
LENSVSDGSDAPSCLVDLFRTLCDARILGYRDAYTPFSTAYPNDRETFPVEKRAEKMPKQHLTAPRYLDQEF